MACDDCPIHTGVKSEFIIENLESMGAHALLLPKHTPELNPIELMFHIMVLRLKNLDMDLNLMNKDSFLQCLNSVGQSISSEDIIKCCSKCGCTSLIY